MPDKLHVNLDQTAIINVQTGETLSPEELVSTLREIEREITRCDEQIVGLASALKAAREAREEQVQKLRAWVRESEAKPMPLFEEPS